MNNIEFKEFYRLLGLFNEYKERIFKLDFADYDELRIYVLNKLIPAFWKLEDEFNGLLNMDAPEDLLRDYYDARDYYSYFTRWS